MRSNYHLYIEWLNSYISAERAHHNHKETMAWGATALYLPTIVGLGHIIGTNHLICVISSVMTLFIIIAAIVFLRLFINMQFRERWESADRVQIISKFVVQFLVGDFDSKLTPDDRQPSKVEGVWWPQIIENEMKSIPISRCWTQALKLLFTFRCKKLDPRWKTELASHFMIIGATIVAILLIYCN